MSKKSRIPQFFINGFYESKFKDNLFVIKAGGKIIEDEKALENLLSNIRDLNHVGIKVLLIYGGGRAMDELAEKRGVEVKKTGGKRITDAANMQIVKEVLGGDLSLRVSAAMAKAKVDGLSLNAVPADWMDVVLTPKCDGDDFTGGIKSVDNRSVSRVLRSYNFVASACLAITYDGTVCNINADTIATQLAVGAEAHKLIFLSDVDGVLINGETAHLITDTQIEDYIADGTVTGGMQVKLESCKDAMDAGVKRIHLINGLRDDALKKEIFESTGPGTMLIPDSARDAYENEVSAQKIIEGKG
jgi:acetylglutamate kinase